MIIPGVSSLGLWDHFRSLFSGTFSRGVSCSSQGGPVEGYLEQGSTQTWLLWGMRERKAGRVRESGDDRGKQKCIPEWNQEEAPGSLRGRDPEVSSWCGKAGEAKSQRPPHPFPFALLGLCLHSSIPQHPLLFSTVIQYLCSSIVP